MREATTPSFTMYAKIKEGVEFPFAKIECDGVKTVKQTIDIPVYVGGVKYYDHLDYGFENGKPYVYIGDVLRIPIADEGKPPKEITFVFKASGTLNNRIADSNFMIALSQNKEICIGDKVPFDVGINKSDEILRLNESNAIFKRVKAALDYFGVKADMDMDVLTDADYNKINNLIRAAEGNKMRYNDKELPLLFYSNLRIGNILIRILSKRNETDDDYNLFNAFINDAHVRMEVIDQEGGKKNRRALAFVLAYEF